MVCSGTFMALMVAPKTNAARRSSNKTEFIPVMKSAIPSIIPAETNNSPYRFTLTLVKINPIKKAPVAVATLMKE